MVAFTNLAIALVAAAGVVEADPQRPGHGGGRPCPTPQPCQPCPPTAPCGQVTSGNHIYRIDNVRITKNNDQRTTDVYFQLHNTAGFQQDVHCSPTDILSGQSAQGQFQENKLYACHQGSPWKFSYFPDRNGLQIKHGNYHMLNQMLVGTTTIPLRCDNQGFGRGELCYDTSSSYVSVMQNSV